MNTQNCRDTKCSGKLHGLGRPFNLFFGNQKCSTTTHDISTENSIDEIIASTTKNYKSKEEITSAAKTEINTQWSPVPLEIPEKMLNSGVGFKELIMPSISSSNGKEESLVTTHAQKSQACAAIQTTSGRDLSNCNGIIQLCLTKMNSYAIRYLERKLNSSRKNKRHSGKALPPVCNANGALMDLDTQSTQMVTSDFGSSDELYSGYTSSKCNTDDSPDRKYSVKALKEKHGSGEELVVAVIQELHKVVKDREQLQERLRMQHMLLKKTRRRVSIVSNDKTCKTVRMNLNHH